MIPDFVTKTQIPKKKQFPMGQKVTKRFRRHKNELCANPVVQPNSLQKETTITLKKQLTGFLSQELHPAICVAGKYMCYSGATLIKQRVWSTGNCLCGHKIGAIFFRKTI